jgi:prephenate dehydrogenase
MISIHPLFGPGVKNLSNQRIALIPVLNSEDEKSKINMIFPRTEIIVVEAGFHDRTMSLTLSLPHLINMMFGSLLIDEDINVLRKLGGTSFLFQLVLCESIMTERELLYASTQIKNNYVITRLEDLISRAKMLLKWIREEDYNSYQKFYKDLQVSLNRDKSFNEAYGKMYRILEELKDNNID